MKNKMKQTTKEASRKYVKTLSWILYFYFGIILVGLFAMTFVMDIAPHDFAEYFTANSWLIIISVLGIFFAYKISKLKQWAFIAEIVLLSVELVALIILSLYFRDGFILPLIPLVLIIFLIKGLKKIK